MISCFISHTWREGQHDFALRLRDVLRSRGVEAWVDEEQIRPAQSIEDRMEQGISHESDVFLFVMSPEALESDNCRKELNWALEQRRKSGMQIVPILRKGCRIPESLQNILYVDFRDDKGFYAAVDRLLTGIQSAGQIKLLCTKLSDGEPEERIEAAQTLAGLRNRFTVPVIAQRRSMDYNPVVRYWLAIALGMIGGEETIAALRQAMGESNPYANLGVIDALTLLGEEALGVVLEAAASNNPLERRTAARVLAQMDRRDLRIKAALAQLENDPDERVRSAVRSLQ